MGMPSTTLNAEQIESLQRLAQLRQRSPEQVLDELLSEALELAELDASLQHYPKEAAQLSEEQALAIASEAVRAVRRSNR
jgi:hypothetical protein